MRLSPSIFGFIVALLVAVGLAQAGPKPTIGRRSQLVLGPHGGTRGFKFEAFKINGEGRVSLNRDIAGQRVDVKVAFPQRDTATHLFKMFQVVRTAWAERARSVRVILGSRYHEAFGRDAFIHDMLRAVGSDEVQFADGAPGAPQKDAHIVVSQRPTPRRSAKAGLLASSSLWGSHPDDPLAAHISASLDVPALHVDDKPGPGGDMDVTLPENPRGKEIFLMHTRSIQTEAVHQELLKTLRTAWTAKRAGAKKVTLVMPYLVYSRSDRKVVGFSDLGIATMARLMKAAGVDQIVTTSVHQPQEVGIFEALDMRVVHLSGERILAQRTAQRLKEHAGKLSVVAKGATNEATARAMAQRLSEAFGVAIPVRVDPNEPGVGEVPVSIGGLAVVAPDAGAAKRAKMFARLLAQNLGLPGKAIDVQVASKERTADGSKTKTTFDGDLTGKIAVIIDDETASGGTLRDIAAAAASKGAVAQIAAVSHLMGDAASTLAKSPHLERLIVTDTVPLMTRRIATGSKVDVAPMGETFGHVMRALDNGRSTHQWSFIEQAAD